MRDRSVNPLHRLCLVIQRRRPELDQVSFVRVALQRDHGCTVCASGEDHPVDPNALVEDLFQVCVQPLWFLILRREPVELRFLAAERLHSMLAIVEAMSPVGCDKVSLLVLQDARYVTFTTQAPLPALNDVRESAAILADASIVQRHFFCAYNPGDQSVCFCFPLLGRHGALRNGLNGPKQLKTSTLMEPLCTSIHSLMKELHR